MSPDRRGSEEHPTRRALLDLLAEGEELSAAEIEDRLPGERPRARIIYHLLVLGERGLVLRAEGHWRHT